MNRGQTMTDFPQLAHTQVCDRYAMITMEEVVTP
jgi:hypothetical protein